MSIMFHIIVVIAVVVAVVIGYMLAPKPTKIKYPMILDFKMDHAEGGIVLNESILINGNLNSSKSITMRDVYVYNCRFTIGDSRNKKEHITIDDMVEGVIDINNTVNKDTYRSYFFPGRAYIKNFNVSV